MITPTKDGLIELIVIPVRAINLEADICAVDQVLELVKLACCFHGMINRLDINVDRALPAQRVRREG